MLPKWQLVPADPQGASKLIPEEKRPPAYGRGGCLLSPAACSCVNHFHFTTGLFWALPSFLACFSNITQEIMGVLRFHALMSLNGEGSLS